MHGHTTCIHDIYNFSYVRPVSVCHEDDTGRTKLTYIAS